MFKRLKFLPLLLLLMVPLAVQAQTADEGAEDEVPAVMQLVINEAMVDNEDTIDDPQGEDEEDWIEIYNPTDTPIDLLGLYLSDDPYERPTRYRFTQSVIVPANGYVIIWTDDDESDGPDHTNFSLRNGETIALITSDGSRFIHRVTVFGLGEDESAGLLPNGDKANGTFGRLPNPTPLADNATLPAGEEGGDHRTPGTCITNVPVHTQDAAPSNGTLVFKVHFGERGRLEGATTMTWHITEGEQLSDALAPMPRPSWARVWWRPAGDNDWYLLPSQYWMGDGTADSEYGLDCEGGQAPSYHTSFASAIHEDDVPSFDP